MTSSLTATHKDFKKALMRQVSKRLVAWSTSGRLRWGKVKEYKRERFPLQVGEEKRKKERHCITKNLNICRILGDIYKNLPFSDLTEECFSFQFVLIDHSYTKLTCCDSWLDKRSILTHSLTSLLLWACWAIVQIFWAANQFVPLH